MSSKRKWDQPAAEDAVVSKLKADDGRTASEAAAAAAAIAAKIAAQFASGSLGSDSAQKDMHDAEFTSDIDINDVRNRYLLTKGSTQDQVCLCSYTRKAQWIFTRCLQIHEETGASVGTRGVWYPDRSKATEKDPPLYIHISAHTKEMLQSAIDKVNELIAIDMGSLVDKGDKPRERVRFLEIFSTC